MTPDGSELGHPQEAALDERTELQHRSRPTGSFSTSSSAQSDAESLNMDIATLLLGTFALTLLVVTLHAWRLGNEKRDVALLGALAGLSGFGAAVSTAL